MTRPRHVVVVDDEPNIGRSLRLILEGAGYRVTVCETIARFQAERPKLKADLYLLDLRLPDGSGIDLLQSLRQRDDATPVVMISGHGTIRDAVDATQSGAFDFLEKPLARERVLVSVKNVLDAAQTKRALSVMSKEQLAKYEMIGKSAPMQRVFHEIEKVAPTRAGVLITG